MGETHFDIAKDILTYPDYLGVYEAFDVVTSNALQHALSERSHKYDERLVVQLMAAYNRLKE